MKKPNKVLQLVPVRSPYAGHDIAGGDFFRDVDITRRRRALCGASASDPVLLVITGLRLDISRIPAHDRLD